MNRIERRLLHIAFIFAVTGCGSEQPQSAAQVNSTKASTQSAGQSPAVNESAGEMGGFGESLPDTAGIFAWTPTSGNRRIGVLPGDVNVPAASRIVPGGLLAFRHRRDAGDYYETEPWLVPFDGGPGRSLGKPDISFWHHLVWLPNGGGVVRARGTTLEFLDARSYAPMRSVRLPVDSTAHFLGLSISTDGRLAATVGSEEAESATDHVGTTDLLVLRPDGSLLTRFDRIAPLFRAELWFQFAEPVWLPDGRILVLGDTATRTRSETSDPGLADDDGIGRRILVVDVARHTVEPTDVVTQSVEFAARPALIAIDEGRLYDLAARAYRPLPAIEGISPWFSKFSPDGTWVTGARTAAFGVLRLSDGQWFEIGEGSFLGWGPNNEVYWTTAKGL